MSLRVVAIAIGLGLVLGLGWWLVRLALEPPSTVPGPTDVDTKPPAVIALSPYGLRPWSGERGVTALRLVFHKYGGGAFAVSTPERLEVYRMVEIDFRSGSFSFMLQPGSYRVDGYFLSGELGLEVATGRPSWGTCLPVRLHPASDPSGDESPAQRRLADAMRQLD